AVGERLVELAELLVGGAAIGPGARPVGIDAQRFVAIGHGLLVVAAEIVGRAAVGIGLGVVGLEPDRLVVVGDGAADAMCVAIDDAALLKGLGILRIERDRLREISFGTGEIAAGLARQIAAKPIGPRILVVERNRPIEIGQSLGHGVGGPRASLGARHQR